MKKILAGNCPSLIVIVNRIIGSSSQLPLCGIMVVLMLRRAHTPV